MSATAATLTKLLAWRPGGYLRASGVLFGWLALRTAAQMALFVLVARSMGADGYGALIAQMNNLHDESRPRPYDADISFATYRLP